MSEIITLNGEELVEVEHGSIYEPHIILFGRKMSNPKYFIEKKPEPFTKTDLRNIISSIKLDKQYDKSCKEKLLEKVKELIERLKT